VIGIVRDKINDAQHTNNAQYSDDNVGGESDYERAEQELLKDGDGRDPRCKVYVISHPSTEK
jgi:hypothetical protein